MIAWRTFACTVAALSLVAFSNCGDDGEVSTGLSAGGGGGSSGESSSSGGGSSGATSDATTASSDSATTSNPTTGPSTTGPSTTGPSTTGPNTTGDGSTGGGSTGGGMAGCGNGKIDPNEQCDGANLNGFTCESLGNAGGTLKCDPVTCTFDTSMCDGGGGGTSG